MCNYYAKLTTWGEYWDVRKLGLLINRHREKSREISRNPANNWKNSIQLQKINDDRDPDTPRSSYLLLVNYEKNIKPVTDFYKKYNLLKVINGERPISQISEEISGLINSIKG